MVNIPGNFSHIVDSLVADYNLKRQGSADPNRGGVVRLDGVKALADPQRQRVLDLLESNGLRGNFETSRAGRKEFLVITAPHEGRIKRFRDGASFANNASSETPVAKKNKTSESRSVNEPGQLTNHLSHDTLFKNLLDLLGTDSILKSLCAHLGEPSCEIVLYDPDAGGRATRNWNPPNDSWVGLRFDGAHWKGYRDGKMVADSYSTNVQMGGTNNFCQSFACVLLAKRAGTQTGFKPGQYGENIQMMSRIWLDWLDQPEHARALVSEISDMAHEQDASGEACYPEISLPQIKETLLRLSTEAPFAKELAQSKE
jgi:hypothetical protein